MAIRGGFTARYCNKHSLVYIVVFIMQLPSSKWRPYLKKTTKMSVWKKQNKSQGKMTEILEKSGNFVGGKMWEP